MSTVRKRANESGHFVRQASINGRTAFILLDKSMNIKLATTKQGELQDAVYAL